MPPLNNATTTSSISAAVPQTQLQEGQTNPASPIIVVPQKSKPVDFFVYLAIFSLKISLVASVITIVDRFIRKVIPVNDVAPSGVYSSLLSSRYFSGFPTLAVSTLIICAFASLVFFFVLRRKENTFPGYSQMFVSTLEKSAVAYVCLSGVFSVLIKFVYDFIEDNVTTQSITIAIAFFLIFLFTSLYHFFLVTREREKAMNLSFFASPSVFIFFVILIGISFFTFDRPVSLAKQAEDTRTASEMSQLQNRISLYAREKGAFPASLEEVKSNSGYQLYSKLSTVNSAKPSLVTYKIIEPLAESSEKSTYNSSYLQMSGKVELCADFHADTTLKAQSPDANYQNSDYTDYTKHTKGKMCFTPTIKVTVKNKIDQEPPIINNYNSSSYDDGI